MLIYSLIPARSGSKRIKDKNLLKINGKTLLEISIKHSLKTKEIHKTFVSGLSMRGLQQARKIEVGELRPNI